ncbi:MAG: hypothetical protein MRQ11_03395 [Candidatus Midichloria mitochondrii]|uniref:hypothetical protein n=1 Tax=Candidatus Midichloria mitochondrii TaxID=234827 RepID=UPI0002D98F99|nr:hypothetical protein [Candidatus Midichloria mitochondrii]MDJ1256428.1 hypothetical protein [Candidatus Midichloria mitochondrii]MDJ1288095.1 hypothetical protein [Candidatus Midichloria mitochondrii]MDJ1298970.1 hypothetical protein [Candidatus Midichloria mitochondrii]MDJ1313140.1 hypothetical protein [Candidatus Midichloria mitochondrii]MDJ1583724.1 hypothetical protein [Candidatus Midichloria mitochondrii]
MGIGLRGEHKINDYLVGRLAGDYFSLSAPIKMEDVSDDIEGEVTFTLGSGLNLHPLQMASFYLAD